MREYGVLQWYEEPPSEAWSAIELDSIELDGVLGALEGGRSEWFDGLARLSRHGGGSLRWRCTTLFGEMRKAGFVLG